VVNLNPRMVNKQLSITLDPGETPEMLQTKINESMQENIFPNVGDPGKVHKFFQNVLIGMVQKFNWILVRTSPETRNWFWFHVYLKDKLLHRVLKLFRWLFKSTLITDLDKIPIKPWNNIIRIWRYNKHESLVDIWRVWNYQQQMRMPDMSDEDKAKVNPEERGKMVVNKNLKSYSARKTFLDFETTMVIMDTADRARVEIEMLRNCHSLMEMYGISDQERDKVPQYNKQPLYTAGIGKDPEYFLRFRNVPIWQVPIEVKNNEQKKHESREDKLISGRKKRTVKTSNKEGEKSKNETT